jgi:glycosyltransferase involved in cell wall biosynthesis
MDLSQITPLILTFNEKENVGRTVGALAWAKEIVILDSGSTDRTVDIARSVLPNVRIVTRPFDNHTAQWNFGLDRIETPWVLSLDADYFVGDEFITELGSLNLADDVSGYSAKFKYCIEGVPLRASVYPPRVVLFRRDRSRYRDDGHTQVLETRGKVLPLSSAILHDDRKPLTRWFREQKRYSKIEARHLLKIKKEKGGSRKRELKPQDRLRLTIVFAAPAMFFYLLFIRGLILDGWAGCVYTFQRTLAELLLSWRLLAERFRGQS